MNIELPVLLVRYIVAVYRGYRDAMCRAKRNACYYSIVSVPVRSSSSPRAAGDMTVVSARKINPRHANRRFEVSAERFHNLFATQLYKYISRVHTGCPTGVYTEQYISRVNGETEILFYYFILLLLLFYFLLSLGKCNLVDNS